MFKSKVHQIQVEMLESGEIYRTNAGLKLSKQPRNALLVGPLSMSTPVSTPPTTPKTSTDQHGDGLKLWQSMDSNVQTRVFYDMLRTAKDPQSLFHVWEHYCAEARRRESTTETVPERLGDHAGARRSVSGPRSSDSHVGISLKSPPPQPPKVTDLKAMLEARLHEASLKRQRAKEEAEKAGGSKSKRVKAEHE